MYEPTRLHELACCLLAIYVGLFHFQLSFSFLYFCFTSTLSPIVLWFLFWSLPLHISIVSSIFYYQLNASRASVRSFISRLLVRKLNISSHMDSFPFFSIDLRMLRFMLNILSSFMPYLFRSFSCSHLNIILFTIWMRAQIGLSYNNLQFVTIH